MAATVLNPKFDQKGQSESLDLSADAYSTWAAAPKGATHAVFQINGALTDAVGVLKFEGRVNSSMTAITPLPFEETDGTVDTDGYDIDYTADASPNTAFVLPVRLPQLRAFFDRTSGSADDLTIAIGWIYAG